MTVSTSYSALLFNGNSSTTAFAVSWPFFTGSLVVTAIDAAGARTTKTITTHYTVSGGTDSNGLPATGTVTMLTAPATGTQLEIARSTPITQSSVWNDNAAFPAKTIESQLDRRTLIEQELEYNSTDNLIDFTLTAGTTTTGAAGSSVIATVTGDYPDFEINLTIPRGDAGASGDGTGDMLAANNLSDVASTKTAYDTISIHGADVASASTIDLDAATGNLVDVTGTTSITAITLANGRERTVRFTGALTLTHGASLVLPSAANITTAAGDYAVFRGYAAGVVRCVNYSRANGVQVGYTPANLAGDTFTGTVRIHAGQPQFILGETDAGADSKYWKQGVQASVLAYYVVNDADSVIGDTWLQVTRSGNSVTAVDFLTVGAAELARAGNVIWDQANVGTQLNALTTDASPDTAADYMLTYDASAAAPKKVLLSSIAANTGWEKIGTTTIGAAVASVTHSWSAAAYTQVLVQFSDLSQSAGSQALIVYLMTASGGSAIVTTTSYQVSGALMSSSAAGFMTGHVLFDIGTDAATKRSTGFGIVSESGGTTGTMGVAHLEPATGGNATDAKAVTLAFNSGNIDDGVVTVYGLKA